MSWYAMYIWKCPIDHKASTRDVKVDQDELPPWERTNSDRSHNSTSDVVLRVLAVPSNRSWSCWGSSREVTGVIAWHWFTICAQCYPWTSMNSPWIKKYQRRLPSWWLLLNDEFSLRWSQRWGFDSLDKSIPSRPFTWRMQQLRGRPWKIDICWCWIFMDLLMFREKYNVYI